MHIILVEDDAQLGDAIRRALERLAYTISWFRDGNEALAAMRDHEADLVLLDLGLPGKDGMDVLVEARQMRLTTPVIVMSAREALDSRIRVLDAGADDYLVKPFHLDELAAQKLNPAPVGLPVSGLAPVFPWPSKWMALPMEVSTRFGLPTVVTCALPILVRLSKRQVTACWATAGMANAMSAAARSFMCTPAYGNARDGGRGCSFELS